MYKVLFIFIFFPFALLGQNDLDNSSEKFYHQEKFQKWADDFEKGNVFNFKYEDSSNTEILDTKEKALEFAKQIISIKIPKSKESEISYAISEDKTSKLWFVSARIKKAVFGGEVYLIFFKGNCKVIWFYKTS